MEKNNKLKSNLDERKKIRFCYEQFQNASLDFSDFEEVVFEGCTFGNNLTITGNGIIFIDISLSSKGLKVIGRNVQMFMVNTAKKKNTTNGYLSINCDRLTIDDSMILGNYDIASDEISFNNTCIIDSEFGNILTDRLSLNHTSLTLTEACFKEIKANEGYFYSNHKINLNGFISSKKVIDDTLLNGLTKDKCRCLSDLIVDVRKIHDLALSNENNMTSVENRFAKKKTCANKIGFVGRRG